MAKKIRDETIIDALLISATVRSAAAKLEINEQTIYRRKRDPEFMQKYNEARRERTEAARNVLQERAHAAADSGIKARIASLQAIAAQKQTGVAIMTLLENGAWAACRAPQSPAKVFQTEQAARDYLSDCECVIIMLLCGGRCLIS